MSRGQEILNQVQDLTGDPSEASFSDVNRAYREIGRLTHWNFLRKNSQSLLAFQASDNTYTLDMSVMRRLVAIWIRKSTGQQKWVELTETPPALFESKVLASLGSDGTATEKPPNFYKLEGGPVATVTITPTPDTALTVRVDYIARIIPLSMDVEPLTPADYDDTIALLASGYILERSEGEGKQILARKYISRALGQFGGLVSDVHANRTAKMERSPQTWLR